MFGRKNKKQEQNKPREYIICPYCETRITEDSEPIIIDKEGFLFVGCPDCKKFIGAAHEF